MIFRFAYPVLLFMLVVVAGWVAVSLSGISFRLSAKDIKNKVLADCCSLTAESSIHRLVVSGWALTNCLK